MKTWTRGAVVLLTAFTFLGGCQSGQTPNRTANLLVQPNVATDLGYRVQWQTPLGLAASSRVESVKMLDGLIVARSTGNVFSVVDAESGKVLWTKALAQPVDNFMAPVLAGERLVLSTGTRAYIHNARTGEELRIVPLMELVSTSPVIDDEYAIYGTTNGRIFAQDLRDSIVRWQYRMGSAIVTNPVQANSSVIVSDLQGDVAAFNLITGQMLWRQNAWKALAETPLVANGTLYAASTDQTVYAVDAASGNIKWQHLTEHALTESPVLIGDRLFQSVPGEGLLALDANTGQVLWRLEAPARALTQRGEQLLVRIPRGFGLVDVATGNLTQRIAAPAVDRVLAKSTTGGDLYTIRRDGRIMKLSPAR